MASPAVSRKARKQNFSASEIAILTEKVEETFPLYKVNLRTASQTKKKMKYGVKSRMLSTP